MTHLTLARTDAAPPDAPEPAPQTATAGAGSIPVSGTLVGTPVTGRITELTSRVIDGTLTVVGTITCHGHGTDAFSARVLDLDNDVAPTVLMLDLGPLDLGPAGPAVGLDPVILDAGVVPGSGELLGILVRALSLLRDQPGGGAPSDLSAVLNKLLFGLGL